MTKFQELPQQPSYRYSDQQESLQRWTTNYVFSFQVGVLNNGKIRALDIQVYVNAGNSLGVTGAVITWNVLSIPPPPQNEVLWWCEDVYCFQHVRDSFIPKTFKRGKTGLSPPVFLYWPFQGGTSVVVPYCYLFLLSVFSYYVSDVFCKF